MTLDKFRRLFNRVEGTFDRDASLQDLHLSPGCGDDRRPLTAKQALELVLPTVREFDRGAALKSIVSEKGLDSHGASSIWEFFFDLVNRRAQLASLWRLSWDEAADDYGPATLQVNVRPFPPANSPLRKMVSGGQLLQAQLVGMWKQEMDRSPDLPLQFRDTDLALADFIRQGLDFAVSEFSVTTGRSSQGSLGWIAEARRNTYYASF